jgi:hypothetical protein
LFVSYAHEDIDWVSALQEQLSERLLHRLGRVCDIWQDDNRLRVGQKWSEEIAGAIRESSAFLAVLSRSYQASKWCEKELDSFLAKNKEACSLVAGGYSRFLKVLKFPWYKNAHTGFYPEFQHVAFFDRDPRTGQEREFKQSSAAFRNAIDKLSFHVEQLFEAMLRSMAKVYVARAAEDAEEERDAIARQLKAEGYALTPPPDGAIPKGLDSKVLKEFVGDAPVTVHLLGASYDAAVRGQIDLAIEAGKRLIFCLTRGHASATGEQARLIESIRENKWKLKEGSWALLEHRSEAALMQDLLGLLVPDPRRSMAPEDLASRVYLLCDPTTQEDAAFAREVQQGILAKEQMRVELPQVPSDTFSPAAQHDRLLSECDGLLVYCEKAPTKWYSRTVGDLLTAEHRVRARALRSKALLSGGAPVALPGLTVIQRRDPFDVSQLEPFLAPLRAPTASGTAPVAG